MTGEDVRIRVTLFGAMLCELAHLTICVPEGTGSIFYRAVEQSRWFLKRFPYVVGSDVTAASLSDSTVRASGEREAVLVVASICEHLRGKNWYAEWISCERTNSSSTFYLSFRV